MPPSPAASRLPRLRAARPGDVPRIAALHRAAWGAMIRRADPAYRLSGFYEGAWTARWCGPLAGAGRVAVLDAGPALAGVAWLGPMKNRGMGVDGRALLRRLFVAPAWQGRGQGGRLLAWAEAAARDAGAHQLEVWCLEANPGAAAFYLRRGFARRGDTGVVRLDGAAWAKRRFRKRWADPPGFGTRRRGPRRAPRPA